MYCKKCGNQINDNAVFCQRCGTKTDESAAPNLDVPAYASAPVPKAAFPLKYVLIPTGIVAGAAVIIAGLISSRKQPQSPPAASGYVQQVETAGSSNNSSGGADSDSGGNAAASLPEAPKETYASPKTSRQFTIPGRGRAAVVIDGEEKEVPCENISCSITEYIKYDNYFSIYFDGLISDSNQYGQFRLKEDSSWEAGKTYSLDDLKSEDCRYITLKGFHLNSDGNYEFSWAKYGNVFKDAQFSIIKRDTSTGEMTWYFYIKTSADRSYKKDTIVIEGVGHTFSGEYAN